MSARTRKVPPLFWVEQQQRGISEDDLQGMTEVEQEEARRREQQEREENRREAEERAKAYRRFAAATTFGQPLSAGPEQEKQYFMLNETFTNVQLYATGPTLTSAQQLYEAAVSEVDNRQEGNTTESLSEQRRDFWDNARQDLHE